MLCVFHQAHAILPKLKNILSFNPVKKYPMERMGRSPSRAPRILDHMVRKHYVLPCRSPSRAPRIPCWVHIFPANMPLPEPGKKAF